MTIADVATKLKHGFKAVYCAVHRVFDGDLTTIAGGMALFSLLATVPMIAAIVAIYGLAADPGQVNAQIAGLDRVLPRAVVGFLAEQLGRADGGSTRSLTTTLISSVALAMYSARGAVNAAMSGLNQAYRRIEHRSRWRRYLATVGLAAGAIVSFIVLVFAVVALPLVIKFVHAPETWQVMSWLRWPLLLVFVSTLFGLLYRFAPARERDRNARRLRQTAVWPGAVLGTAIWMGASVGLSWWVENVASYEILYGAFASVIVVILWFYASALALLIGASLNAELAGSK